MHKAIITCNDGTELRLDDLESPDEVMEYMPFKWATVVSYLDGRAPKVREYAPSGRVGFKI